MKKTLILSVAGSFLFFACPNLQAQHKQEKTNETKQPVSEEDDSPTMFKFEPDFLTTSEMRKVRIQEARKMLDTMDISERKRRKLLKDLHKNGITERLSKTLYADTKFEDIEN